MTNKKLRARVQDLKAQVANLETQVADLKTQVTRLTVLKRLSDPVDPRGALYGLGEYVDAPAGEYVDPPAITWTQPT